MRMLRPLLSALTIGVVAGALVGSALVTLGDTATMTPAEEELARLEHVKADLADWQAAIDNGEAWDGPTPYVAPEPSWPAQHPWIVAFLVADVVALIAWLILVRSVFAGAPLPESSADESPPPAVDHPATPPKLTLVPDTNTRPFPHTPAD